LVLGVWVSSSLMLFDVKPSSLGFTALRIPFHRDPCHRAPPTLGNPSPQLPLHCFLWVITVGKPPHPGSPKHASLGSPRYTRISRRPSIEEASTTLINLYENQKQLQKAFNIPCKCRCASALGRVIHANPYIHLFTHYFTAIVYHYV